MKRSWAVDRIAESEIIYDEYQDVKTHPKLKEGKWEFAPASYSWLGQKVAKPDAVRDQTWQLYAVVEGQARQERAAALALGTYEFTDPEPNRITWRASDLPPGHFMWPDSAAGGDFVHSASTWEEIAATRTLEDVGVVGGGRAQIVTYTVDWTLEIDSFWEKQGVPVYAGSPAGLMDGYTLEVFGRDVEAGEVVVTSKNFRETGFGGKFNKNRHPKFEVGAPGTTFVAASARATPFITLGGEKQIAGLPTELLFRVHWVDDLPESTICGSRGQQCCRESVQAAPCNWGPCGEDSTCSGCGQPGESCCDNGTCFNDLTCEAGTCAEASECNGLIQSGGNFGDEVPVDMGHDSGQAVFVMNTVSAADEFVLTNENGTRILQTPCLGTNMVKEVADSCLSQGLDIYGKCVLANGATCYFSDNSGVGYHTCTFTDGWTCNFDTGDCSMPFQYSGGSKITVKVNPNCGDTTDTVWAFEVRCP
jgi:hypothetical protein